MSGQLFFMIILVLFLSFLFLAWYFNHKTREKERLILIEKGIDLSQLPEQPKITFSFPWLKIGLVIFSASLGILIGLQLESSEVAVWLFLFGGIGMIIAHYIDKPKEKRKDD